MPPRRSPAAALEHALATRRILVACGSGGVGKTTTAAALALRAARSGRRVLACTIDPSRRLATSLGLQQLSGRPRPIDLARLGPAPARGGALWAMVLDVKSTFDALVTRYTPDSAGAAGHEDALRGERPLERRGGRGARGHQAASSFRASSRTSSSPSASRKRKGSETRGASTVRRRRSR